MPIRWQYVSYDYLDDTADASARQRDPAVSAHRSTRFIILQTSVRRGSTNRRWFTLPPPDSHSRPSYRGSRPFQVPRLAAVPAKYAPTLTTDDELRLSEEFPAAGVVFAGRYGSVPMGAAEDINVRAPRSSHVRSTGIGRCSGRGGFS